MQLYSFNIFFVGFLRTAYTSNVWTQSLNRDSSTDT